MIQLHYGDAQRFQRRHADINLLGYLNAPLPAIESQYRLNRGQATHFYIEPLEKRTDLPIYADGLRTAGCHRLRHRPGWFNIEIPINCSELLVGWNSIEILINDAHQIRHSLTARFHWNPVPPSFPLHFQDLSHIQSIQDIGQAVNGLFEIDRTQNTIRPVHPVGADVLLLLGPPGRSQEAQYSVEFGALDGIWIGTSDFFAGHLAETPDLGIKPGYCTNGLATLDRRGGVRSWMAWGDNLANNSQSWTVSTKQGAKYFPIEAGVKYRVRHQLRMRGLEAMSRFRIWPIQQREPSQWLCGATTAKIPRGFPRNQLASFGLFQYFGTPTQWSDISLYALDDN
ncbi:MAG: hypothetical protein AAF699_16925 [Pseudomonadota bacterium]